MPMWLNCSIASPWELKLLCFPAPGLWLKSQNDPRKPPWSKRGNDPRKPPLLKPGRDAVIESATQPIGVITAEDIDEHCLAYGEDRTVGRLSNSVALYAFVVIGVGTFT